MVFANKYFLRSALFCMASLLFSSSALAEDFAAPLISAKDPDKAEAFFLKGHKALDNKDGAKAEECYRKAVELNPGEARYHRQLAVLLVKLDRVQEAEREVLIAKHLDNADWRTLLVLATIYHMEKRYDSEVAQYRRVVTMLPPDQKPLQDKLQAYIKTDEIASRREADIEKRKKELEEAPYKNAY